MTQSIDERSDDRHRYSQLTDKQKEALDLLLLHKTSKEIGLDLGISPHTVDQRIQIAKEKLGVSSRSELALEYLRLRAVCQQVTYEDSHIPDFVHSDDQGGGFDAEPSVEQTGPERIKRDTGLAHQEDYRVVPEMFEGRYGTLVRIAAIIATALLMMLVILGGLVMFSQTSELIAG